MALFYISIKKHIIIFYYLYFLEIENIIPIGIKSIAKSEQSNPFLPFLVDKQKHKTINAIKIIIKAIIFPPFNNLMI